MTKEKVDVKRRRFLIAATTAVGGAGAAAAAVPFAASWFPSARARAAGAPVQVDVSKLAHGAMMTVEWRGKPVWIIRRNQEALDTLPKHEHKLRDPNSQVDQQPTYATNQHRSVNPEFLVLIGVCTHLGCAPTFRPDIGSLGPEWPGGFYCPCHGSTFDLAGRVYQGVPAPINLKVPPYKFLADNTILIGEHTEEV